MSAPLPTDDLAPSATTADAIPDFCAGMLHFAEPGPRDAALAAAPVIAAGDTAIAAIDDAAVYQTRLVADALRYTTLQLCASKQSGHPGGFASAADAIAALLLLGHKNMVTEVGHHAPGFYSAMFLDGSLAAMGIETMTDLQTRFRERDGLLGHLSGAIPGSWRRQVRSGRGSTSRWPGPI
jgi:phosphoketolase